ncbi:MAG TPA: hypothetical protein VJN70_02755 [Gemmatimonadaceae bacterium]|nr:hypothetical protein [Gemmatimonadaceae bacterium]
MSYPLERSRAIQLLAKVVASGWLERDDLAKRLEIPSEVVESYVAGDLPMPLDHQLRLAAALEDIPEFARAAQQLRGQVMAAKAFQSHETVTHTTPPPGHSARRNERLDLRHRWL